MRIAVLGRGAQAKRYLDEKNGLGMCRPLSELLTSTQCDAVIDADHPRKHMQTALWCLHGGIPCLIEKPLVMDPSELLMLTLAATVKRSPLLVAHTYLFTRSFERISRRARNAKRVHVDIGGPRPTRHDYGPELDWGPHAYAVGLALDAQSITFGDYAERRLRVTIDGEPFSLDGAEDDPSPMARQVQTLVKLTHGGEDWRADWGFIQDIYSCLFGVSDETNSAAGSA